MCACAHMIQILCFMFSFSITVHNHDTTNNKGLLGKQFLSDMLQSSSRRVEHKRSIYSLYFYPTQRTYTTTLGLEYECLTGPLRNY